MNKKEYLTEDSKFISLYKGFNSSFYLEKAGYFDERPCIHTSVTQLIFLILIPILSMYCLWSLLLIPLIFFGYGNLYLKLPIRTGIQDCESAAYGFNYHDNKIWIYIGGGGNFEGGKKWKTFTMPWYYTWIRTSTLMKSENDWWFNETKKNRTSWVEDSEGVIIGSHGWLNKNKWQETHEYIDKYDNSIVNATISVSEREWRPLWFQWTSLFSKKVRSIDIEFDNEVGKRKGSWKGGTIGCGYNLKPNETPLECLKRMEKERVF